jgi:4-hydroxy-4-methyl-2-oxoglutarate aldolase
MEALAISGTPRAPSVLTYHGGVNASEDSGMTIGRAVEEGLLPVAGDDGVGVYVPNLIREADFPRVSADLLDEVRALTGAATTGSDVLDEFGLALTVSADILKPRVGRGVIVGQALTVAYMPERRALSHPELRRSKSRLAHHSLFAMAHTGDVVVVDARGTDAISVLGGMAALRAHESGVAAFVVDGGVRDLDELETSGLAIWSRSLTPRTGKWRLEASALNLPVVCGGVQVHPGDVVVADHTGVCFFPANVAEAGLRRLLDVAAEERQAVS